MVDDSIIDEHISEQEMFDFLYIKKIDSITIRKFGMVNYHLIKCERCRTHIERIKKDLCIDCVNE